MRERTMYRLSKRSKKNLNGVHPDLVRVVNRAIEITKQDFMVIEGKRTLKKQKWLKAHGYSWTLKSKHLDGLAVDTVPYPIDWNDLDKFHKVYEAFKQASQELNIPIRWGGDWNMNGEYRDEVRRGVYDGGHFELILQRGGK